MGVIIEDIKVFNEFTGSSTNYLLGNVGDKVTVETYIRVQNSFVTSDEDGLDRIYLAPQEFRVNSPNTKDVIHCEEDEVFLEYNVGDLVSFYSSSVNALFEYEIYEKISNNSLRVHTVGGTAGDIDFYAANGNTYDTRLLINSYIFITTEFTSLIYNWNFVENSTDANFQSLIDNKINEAYSTTALDYSDLVTQHQLTFVNPITNTIGTAYVVGNGAFEGALSSVVGQRFKIVLEWYILPIHTAEYYEDLLDNIAPLYYKNSECLKYVAKFQVGRNPNDPNFIQQNDFDELNGNTGWFDENFNGGTNNYYVDSIVYKNNAAEVIDSIELTTNEQTVEIVVKNDLNPFSNNNTEFALNFQILPDDVDDYQNNGKTLIENFYFDRAFNTVGAVAVNGDNFGLDQQIIKNVSASFVATDEIKITATIQLKTAGVTDLTSRTGINYLLFVSTQDHLLDTEESDRVAIKTDIQPFFIDFSDDGLLTTETKFLRHYESDVLTEGTTTPIVRTEDDVLTYSKFYIDRLGRETDEILITSVECSLVAKKTSGAEFTLESFSQSFNGTLIVNDTQFIDNTIDRVFKMPDGEPRKQIKIKRRIDLDTADLRYYEVYYPFLMRWEYWKTLSGVNSDAFDVNLPNNGQNEDWQRYDTLADWDIFYRTTVNITKNGNALSYQNETQLTTFDYLEDVDWTNEKIEAFNADTLDPLGAIIISPCKVVASFDFAGVNPPDLNDVEFVMRIEVYEQGGINDIRYFSSVYDWSENSWFSSTDSSNKLVKSLVGSTYKCQALINFSELPDNAQFKISARIYNESVLSPETCYILTEQGEPIITEGGDNLVIESCGAIEIFGKLMEDGTLKLTENNITKIEEN